MNTAMNDPHKVVRQNVAVVGLGLIGGSMCKAIKFNTDCTVLGYDISNVTLKHAILIGAIDGVIERADDLSSCDVVIIALCPEAAAEYIKNNAQYIKKGALVFDCCGTKRNICTVGFELAAKHGFRFLGGHPMAGTHNSGFKYAREDMFTGATMVIVARGDEEITFLESVKSQLMSSIGFGAVTFAAAEEHDRIIAYTSQLAHVVSNAYVKSPTAQGYKGMSAGSYRDLTRVAKLSEHMWTELFLENADNLSSELDTIIGELTKYNDAIKSGDAKTLTSLLREGREIKEKEESAK
jgi:Prephenate dehydrogenase